jgi:primosomal protein N' (replication factor Y)
MDRMDTDTMKKRGSHDKVLNRFKRHSINMLIGTQMIAKGLDFPKVTLVGVISADTTLNLPDFRASERTFNLLTQVAGRAGRGTEGGEVIIQTYTPEHYAVTAAKDHDYIAFYRKEVKAREELGLPPYKNIIRIILKSRKNARVEKVSKDITAALKKKMKGVEVIGPAPAVVSRIRNQFRWNIIIKTGDAEAGAKELKALLRAFGKPSGVTVSVDVDPISVQ